jgi:DNA modification methylase
LSEVELDFSLEATGFEMGEIDVMIEGLSPATDGEPDPADELPEQANKARVSRVGDLWQLDKHRVLCADATEMSSYDDLMAGKKADVAFTDPPYNVPIDGHVTGLGKTRHAEFPMASGEMSESEFTDFLTSALSCLAAASTDGSIHFVCMDWRHMGELLQAGRRAYGELKNLCVWAKDNAGMGSLYRSQHELIFVFKKGKERHRNNVQLGQFGRYRTNVWNYPGANSFSRTTDEGNLLAMHPTVKPVAMVADAIMDCSARGDIVLDGFLGSGTTLIAAERTGRACYGLELDPGYIDTIVRRWQAFTGKLAIHAISGRSFVEVEKETGNG